MTRSVRSGYPSHRQGSLSVVPGEHVRLSDSAPRPPRVDPWVTTGTWIGGSPVVSFPTGEYLGVPTNDYYFLGVIYQVSAPTQGSDITRHDLPGGWEMHPGYVSPPSHGLTTHDWVTFAWFYRVGHYSDSEVQLPTHKKTVGGVVSPIAVIGGVYMLVKIPDIVSQGAAVSGGLVVFSSNVTAGESFPFSLSFSTGGGRVAVVGTANDFDDVLDFEESPPVSTGLPLKLFFSYSSENETVNVVSANAYLGSTSTSNEEPGRYSGIVDIQGYRLTVDPNTLGPALPDRQSVEASAGPVRLHRF